MKNVWEFEKALQSAAVEFKTAVEEDLDIAKKNLSDRDYKLELFRIAYNNKSTVSASASSTTNLAQSIKREVALNRLDYMTFDGSLF